MKQKNSHTSTITSYLMKDLFDVDEFILKTSSCITNGQGFDAEMIKSNIKRIYFTFEIEKTKEAGVKYKVGTEKIVSKKFYDENKDFFNVGYGDVKLATSLNYDDFFTLNPLIEIVNYSSTLFEKEPFEFAYLFDKNLVETDGDTSKSMLISSFITELDKNYKKLECLLNNSLLPLNTLQEAVIRGYLCFNKEVFRLLLIKYLPLFEKLLEEINYASEVFEKLFKKAIKNKLPKIKNGKVDYGKGFKIDSQPPTNRKKAFELLQKNFISNDAKFNHFQNIFSSSKERDVENQIVWTGTKKALNYLMSNLKNKKLIDSNKYRKTIWQKTERVFKYYDKKIKIAVEMKNVKGNGNEVTESDKIKLDKIIDLF